MHLPRIAFVILLLSLYSFEVLNAQQPTFKISGQLRDTADKRNLENASVVLLKSKDSVLYRSVRTNKEQRFIFNSVDTGKYVLLIVYPGYASLVDKIFVNNKDLDLGELSMNTKIKVMQEVLLKSKVAAIRMRGDTTEYTADSFHVGPNADVQELIRSMPGFQVNAKGEIVTQGEKVNKVLVDGEEFFSDDPAVVTKNLRADAIDKVQVFDKKSDQAVFTGIEDGITTKTINLKMKEDKKKGYFGKAEASTSFDKYNSGRLMVNSFKGKRKAAGYITTDNTSFDGLSWEDSRNYSSGGGNESVSIGDDGGVSISITSGGDDEENQGFPNQQTGGLLFSNKIGKTTTNNGGQYQRLGVDFNGSDRITTLLNGSSQTSTSNKSQQSDKKKYKLNTTNEWGTDSTGYLKIILRGARTLKDVLTDFSGETSDNNNTTLNSSLRNTNLSSEETSFGSSVVFRKKFAKKGRTISFTADTYNKQGSESLFLNSTNTYYLGIIAPRTEHTDQHKTSSQNEGSINGSLVYTEPIGKNDFLLFSYGLATGRNLLGRDTYEKDLGGNYNSNIDSLSNKFRFSNSNNSLSVTYKYVKKKFNAAIGLGAGHVNYNLLDYELGGRSISFNNFLPTANISFNPKQQRRIRFSYFGKTINPTLTQIQPLVDNIDPLNITKGNPNLKQGFTNSFQLNGNDYKVLKERGINLWGTLNTTSNSITTNTTLDLDGKRTTNYTNVNGVYNGNIRLNYGKSVLKGINLNLGLSYNFGRSINFINNIKNIGNNKSYNINAYVGRWGDKALTFYLGGYAGYTTSVSTINPKNNAFWSYSSWGGFTYRLKKQKIYFAGDLDYTAYQKSPLFPDRKNVFLFHPNIKKVFGKGDAWEVKLTVHDLFNQNQNISRQFYGNTISESTHSGIKRYTMVSLVYNFSKNGKPASFGF
jgi:hypothetical protein